MKHEIEVISKESLKAKAQKELKGRTIELVDQVTGYNKGSFAAMNNQRTVSGIPANLTIKNPELSPYKVRINGRPSIEERIKRGTFSNTTPTDILDFIDATRIDVSRRKEAIPKIRGFIYNEVSMPNATQTVKANDLFPYGIVFEQNNGNGESVNMGSWESGNVDTIDINIYAAGFSWTLAAELFNNIFDMQRLNDAVAVGYNALGDNNAIKPILDGTYAGAKLTGAATGGGRQENLYNTLSDAIDDLGNRDDPVTGRKLNVTQGLVLLCSSWNARHVLDVINGQLNDPADSKNLRALREISRVVIYDDEVIENGLKTTTYNGVGDTYMYLIKPVPYFSICEKRGLTQEVGAKDVLTLSREDRAWYFAEGYYNAQGINSYVQKVTVSVW